MLPICGVYEVAIRVADLAKSEVFYREIPGLDVCRRDERRRWLFLRAGGQAGMVVLQEDRAPWSTQHFAFAIEEGDLETAAASLQKRGVVLHGPVHYEWMSAKAVYFSDPDGHELEICALVRKP